MHLRWPLVVLAVAIACLTAGWLGAKAFESPAQRQARARPPAAEPIVAAVRSGTLADEVTARAHVAPAVADRLAPRAVPERAVVTARLLERGSLVVPGSVLLAINGRPLFVLPGQFGFYRDIEDGMTGPDVVQLQAGLTAAGYLPGGVESGTYGPATQAAVEALYRAAGAEPVTRPTAAPEPARPPADDAERTAQPPQRVVLPLAEVVVAPRLPARLASSLNVGDEPRADGRVATITSGELLAHAGVAASVVGRIRPGMRAYLVAAGGRVAEATVVAVGGSHRRGAQDGGDLRDVALRRVDGDLPDSWRGREVLARIITTRVGERSLIVPTRAIAEGTAGKPTVMKQLDGDFVRVPIRRLGSLAGRTAIESVEPGALAAGDRVRVG